MPKPLAGGHELLLTHQELSGSGEDHRALRRVDPTVLKQKCQRDKELVEEPKSFIHIPKEGTGNDSSSGERRPSGICQLQTSSRSVQRQAQRTSEEEESSQEQPRKGKSQSQLAQTLPTGVQDPQIGAFISGQSLQYGQNSHGIQSLKAGKDERDFPTQIIQQIQFVKSIIDVEIGKLDANLNKISSDISKLKINEKNSTEWYKLTNVKLDSITNTCDIIESKCQAQEDELGDISISHVNEQLAILRNQFLDIINNTNQFTTHLAKRDSERQKLKNEIIESVKEIHKYYEPHIQRHSKPVTKEKTSVKGSLTPFLVENLICAKDIPKLEELSIFSGEREENHIEFIRTIDMFPEDFHIPNEIIVGRLHSLFTRTAKKWYYKMRQDHGKHDCPWWKSEIIIKWAKNS
ncbi:hypothetical protein O181_024132 [Austropuccinia psidii MF-1]|uniref:Uncharacterized protein n=1 Tax=Austropuccinia psidii MF-1 TaxID=1389203 RepID=A0A9Q3CIP4_9BASI|nr:hypothetical protein [Austropuccinia psidii MF-1]